jgi:hypothetical protein
MGSDCAPEKRVMRIGTCHLCGAVGPLTFEHIPPRAAFNDARVLEADIDKLMVADRLLSADEAGGTYKQQGAGNYTLCGACNSESGSWYGNEYVSVVKTLYGLSRATPPFAPCYFALEFRPLRFLKQVVAMFASACGPGFTTKHPDVVRFIKNKQSRDLPTNLNFYMSLFDVAGSQAVRQSGITGGANLATGRIDIISEICFPPFNLVMSFSGRSPDPRLFEITWFKNYGYGESSLIFFKLISLPVNSFLPVDYRTREQLEADIAANVAEF